jgi:hypothetical protein
MRILNAYYLPGGGDQVLYDSVSPVNTFRLVFNCYFDAGLPIVQDEVYWSPWPAHTDYEFTLLPTQPETPATPSAP